MQAQTKKLEPVVRHVDKNEQEAMQAVAFSQQQLRMQEEILQKLYQYKDEYTSGQNVSGQVAYGAVQLQEFNRFLMQLDDTIKKQHETVKMAAHEVEVKRQKWKDQRSRAQAMHKVVDRLHASEQHQVQVAEQKIMDEIALRGGIKNS